MAEVFDDLSACMLPADEGKTFLCPSENLLAGMELSMKAQPLKAKARLSNHTYFLLITASLLPQYTSLTNVLLLSRCHLSMPSETFSSLLHVSMLVYTAASCNHALITKDCHMVWQLAPLHEMT